jgi:hypothetical protein
MVDLSICERCEKGKVRVKIYRKPQGGFSVCSKQDEGCIFDIKKNVVFDDHLIRYINYYPTKSIDVINIAKGEVVITQPEICPYYFEHMILTQKENEL